MPANSTQVGVQLSAALLFEWSNCPRVLLFLLAVALGDSVFHRLASVEFSSSGGVGLLRSLLAGCCGCRGHRDDGDGRKGGGRKRKRKGKHRGLDRDSTAGSPRLAALTDAIDEDSWRDINTFRKHLEQPALMLCYAAGIIATAPVIHAATALPRWSCGVVGAPVVGNATAPWLASWSAENGGDMARLERFGLSFYWVAQGLLLFAVAATVLRRSLCSRFYLLPRAAVEGNLAAGIVDAVALLSAGAIVSGALPPRAESATELPLSFLEQNIAAVLSVTCALTAVVIFALLMNMLHLRGRSPDIFVEEEVPKKYRVRLGEGKSCHHGNPVCAMLYGSAVVSYSLLLGKAVAASVELLHLAACAGLGCLLLLLLGVPIAKMLAANKKSDFSKMSDKHNWGFGLVVGATVLSFGLAIGGLIPNRGCMNGGVTAASVTSSDANGTEIGASGFLVPSSLAALEEESFTSTGAVGLLSVENAVAVLLALIGVITSQAFYSLPLMCAAGPAGKKKKKKKKSKSRKGEGCCGDGGEFNVGESVCSGDHHAVSISFAGYALAVGNVLAATLTLRSGGSNGASPLAPRLSQAVAAASTAGGDDTLSVVLGVCGGVLSEVAVTVGPQLAWTAMSFAMMIAAHYIHIIVIGWQIPSGRGSNASDSDSDYDDIGRGGGGQGGPMRSVQRLFVENDCAYGIMDGGMHIVSSFVIASGCAGRALTVGDVGFGWLVFALGEGAVCMFGLVTGMLSSRRRMGGNGDDSSDDEDGCCGRKASKKERKEAKRRRKAVLVDSRAPGPGKSVGQSLNWFLHLLAWVLLLRTAVEAGGDGGVAWVSVTVWAVMGGGVLLGAQRIVMELLLPDLSDAMAAEQVRDELVGSAENWGAGLVGGAVSVSLALMLGGLVPPPLCV